MFRGLIVELTQHKENIPKISQETAKNYYKNVIAIFNYAVNTRLLKENPADDKWIRESFKFERITKKAQFSIDELNKFIKAPIYTGCVDDERLYYKKGNNRPKRARFWIPLIALYNGMRMNEICQLMTEDVKEVKDSESGEKYLTFFIRTEDDKGMPTDKHLKNMASRRDIPVHPEIMQIGFKKYWEGRKKDKDNKRLFQELQKTKKRDSYSSQFSGWFSRFAKRTLGYKPKANFHSFRHMWRDRLREANINIEMVEALGGWSSKGSSEAGYGYGFSIRKKYEALEKVEYPGLKMNILLMFKDFINTKNKLLH